MSLISSNAHQGRLATDGETSPTPKQDAECRTVPVGTVQCRNLLETLDAVAKVSRNAVTDSFQSKMNIL